MTSAEFAMLYGQVRGKAVEVATSVCGNRDDAEDAVQEAAVYCLERIAGRPAATITPSYFIQLTVNRAKDRMKPRGRRHGTGKGLDIERAVGSMLDLERFLHVPTDEN